ncbi:hypothetical protein ACHQM5_011211 [Ranunculus cassubicifolius]
MSFATRRLFMFGLGVLGGSGLGVYAAQNYDIPNIKKLVTGEAVVMADEVQHPKKANEGDLQGVTQERVAGKE